MDSCILSVTLLRIFELASFPNSRAGEKLFDGLFCCPARAVRARARAANGGHTWSHERDHIPSVARCAPCGAHTASREYAAREWRRQLVYSRHSIFCSAGQSASLSDPNRAASMAIAIAAATAVSANYAYRSCASHSTSTIIDPILAVLAALVVGSLHASRKWGRTSRIPGRPSPFLTGSEL